MRYIKKQTTDMCDQPTTIVIDTQAQDNGVIAEFYSKNADEHAELFISVIDTFKQALNRLGTYISENDINQAYEILANVENDNDMADDHIDMWEPLTHKYTVKQLLDECGF